MIHERTVTRTDAHSPEDLTAAAGSIVSASATAASVLAVACPSATSSVSAAPLMPEDVAGSRQLILTRVPSGNPYLNHHGKLCNWSPPSMLSSIAMIIESIAFSLFQCPLPFLHPPQSYSTPWQVVSSCTRVVEWVKRHPASSSQMILARFV